MAKQHMVSCRVCKGKFDAQEEEKDIVWVMPSRNFYYHKKCYDDWKTQTDVNIKKKDDVYIDYIYDYLAHDLKIKYDYFVCEAQREKFLKKGYTNKGIFFTLKYFYEIQKGDTEKSNGGLGIVPYVYNDSITYWSNMVKKQANILEEIEAQMSKMDNVTPTKTINRKKQRKKKDRTAELLAEVENEYKTR